MTLGLVFLAPDILYTMDQTTNSLGNETGGTTPTGNPQNIGGQNLAAPQNNLQSQGSNLFSGSSLRLTDQNGQPLSVSSSSQTNTSVLAASTKVEPTNHRGAVAFGVSGLVIIAAFVITWLTSRQSKNSY